MLRLIFSRKTRGMMEQMNHELRYRDLHKKMFLRLRGHCPGPTFRWTEQPRGLSQHATGDSSMLHLPTRTFKLQRWFTSLLAALTFTNRRFRSN